MSAHYVYRVFDVEGRLVYVGSAADVFARLRSHRSNSWWAPQMYQVKATVFSSKPLALAAETAAIRTESPRCNVKGRYAGHANWAEHDYVDYLTALLNQPGSSPARVRHMHQAGRAYRSHFNKRIPLKLPPHPDGAEEERWLEPHEFSDVVLDVSDAITKAHMALV